MLIFTYNLKQFIMQLVNTQTIQPPSYLEKTYDFTDIILSVRLYSTGGYTFHDIDGFQLDESSDDFHCYYLEYANQIIKSLNLPA